MELTNAHAQTTWIDLNLIDIPDHFREHSPEALDTLVEDIKQHGQLQEIVVAAKPDGRYELVAGKGRTQAIQKLGWQQIRAQVLTGVSELDKAMINISENEEREDVSPIDKALSYQRAIVMGGIDQRELAKRRGFADSTMSEYLALARLPEAMRKSFGRPKLGLAHITEILRLPNPEDQMKLAEKCAKEGMSSKEVRAKVKKMLGKFEDPDTSITHEPEGPFQFTRKGNHLIIRTQVPSRDLLDVYLQEFRRAILDVLAADEKESQTQSPSEPTAVAA